MSPLLPVSLTPRSRFDPAVEVVLRHEGGWVNDPRDPGGETNFGISLHAIVRQLNLAPSELGLLDFRPGCMKQLTKDSAKLVYFKHYWVPHCYSALLDQRIATKVFDAAINMGPANAHRCLQRAINALGVIHVDEDGVLGPETLRAANASNQDALLLAMVESLGDYYRGLAAAKPELRCFLSNWLKRAAWTGRPGDF